MFSNASSWTEFYSVELLYKPKEDRITRNERRKRETEILKQHGIDRNALRWHFRNTDPQAVKDAAKAKAEAAAADVIARTGVTVEAVNGSYL